MSSSSVILPQVVHTVDATAPLASSGGASPIISLPKADASTDGYLSASDFTSLSAKVPPTRSVTLNAPLSGSGTLASNITVSLAQSSTSTDGYLSSTDFNTFNNKINDAQIYYHFPVDVAVVENDVVMNVTNPNNGQAPIKFVQATNGDQQYYVQIYGIAKNVSSGYADIYLAPGSVVSGFSFGLFVGVEYYIDPANPGKLTWTPPVGTLNAIKVGRALTASQLILDVYSQFVQDKGAIYTSDGSGYDSTLLVGSNGNVLVANSAAANGINWAPAVVASAPFTYTTSTRALTIATATNSVPGVLSAADHTTYSGYAATIALKAPLASPTFTGDVNSSTGNVLVSTLGKGLQVKTGTNSKIGTAVLVAGTKTVSNTSVTANSLIFLTSQADGGVVGSLRVSAKTANTSFVITSSSALDTSTVAWMIVESIP